MLLLFIFLLVQYSWPSSKTLKKNINFADRNIAVPFLEATMIFWREVIVLFLHFSSWFWSFGLVLISILCLVCGRDDNTTILKLLLWKCEMLVAPHEAKLKSWWRVLNISITAHFLTLLPHPLGMLSFTGFLNIRHAYSFGLPQFCLCELVFGFTGPIESGPEGLRVSLGSSSQQHENELKCSANTKTASQAFWKSTCSCLLCPAVRLHHVLLHRAVQEPALQRAEEAMHPGQEAVWGSRFPRHQLLALLPESTSRFCGVEKTKGQHQL